MKSILYFVFAAYGLAIACFARYDSDTWSVREQEMIQRNLPLSATGLLMIKNVDGYVHVTGASGSEVRVKAHKIILAGSVAEQQQARREVKLDVTEEPGSVSIYYDAPWRCDGTQRSCGGEQSRSYKVIYDIDVEVPFGARTEVSTFNIGDVRIENTDGDFNAKNINGAVTITSASGSGDVQTINGPIAVHFAKNPSDTSSFKSINGQIDVYFQPNLSADLLFKTLNAQIHSDFDVIAQPARVVGTKQDNGKFIYRSHGTRWAAWAKADLS